jgi:hypothetical protein
LAVGKNYFKNPPQVKRENKLLADTEETILSIPIIVKVIEVELAIVVINIEIRNLTIVIGIMPNGANKNRFQPSGAPPLQYCRG